MRQHGPRPLATWLKRRLPGCAQQVLTAKAHSSEILSPNQPGAMYSFQLSQGNTRRLFRDNISNNSRQLENSVSAALNGRNPRETG